MGSAISAIAAGTNPVKILSPYEREAQQLKLQEMRNQAPLVAEQLKTGQLENQQRQMDLADQQILRDAFKESGGDLDKMRQGVIQRGGSPKAVFQIQQQSLAMREAFAKLTDQELKNNHAKLEDLGARASSLLADPTRADKWSQVRADLIASGDVAPEAVPESYPGDDWLKLHANDAVAVKDQIAAVMKEREVKSGEITAAARQKTAETSAAEAAAKIPGIQADTAQKVRQQDATALAAAAQQGPEALQAAIENLPYGRAKAFEGAKTPEAILAVGQTPEQRLTTAATVAQRAETARHNAVEESARQKELNLQAAGLRVRQTEADPFGQFGLNPHPVSGAAAPGGGLLTGDEYLKTLPAGMAAQVKAIAEGRQNPPPRASSGVPLQIMNAVNQYDPAFSLQRAQIRKAFTTGSDGRNIGALNTASVHLDQLSEAAKALSNGSFVPGNAIWNSLQATFGGSAPTNFNQVKSAVAGEMASALKGNATDAEIKNMSENITRASSPKQLQDAIDTNLHVLGAKLNTYQERYSQQVPDDKNWTPVLPSAKAVFDKHGLNPTAGPAANIAPAKASSSSKTIGSKAEYDALPSGTIYTNSKDSKQYRKP